MFFGDAEANTSAGAPLVIWAASVELAPKLNVTFTPGWAASNCWPIVVNASFSEDAANTVIAPVNDAEALALALALLALGELPEPAVVLLPDEHAAKAEAAIAAAMTVMAKRRTLSPGVGLGEN
jgi:hypothetical protein